jgi:uncharacterized protein YjbI with pentapeptide repeats
MANQDHLDILAKGVAVWNVWRKAHPILTPDLSYCAITEMDLNQIDFSSANLRGCDLSHSGCADANFSAARLEDSNFSSAIVSGSDFRAASMRRTRASAANLKRAVLASADLRSAIFRETLLDEADFTSASIGGTVFADVSLRNVTGLETLRHRGPSTIGLDTIFRSHSKLPDGFLRGAGVPDNIIQYLKSLGGTAFDFCSVFISYSTKDQDFADRLHADLQARGVRCWFAPHDIQGGRKIHEQIDEAIKLYDKLLLILSDASMNSHWVKTEIANARMQEEQHSRQMLFPITLVPYERIRSWKLFDGDTGIDSAREIREYFVPDFSNWKNQEAYQQVFEKLVRDLKAGRVI